MVLLWDGVQMGWDGWMGRVWEDVKKERRGEGSVI